jgi:diguanylate cyclase (GGDEF)-like protein
VEVSSKGTLRVRNPQLVGDQPGRLRFRLRLVAFTVALLVIPLSAVAWFVDRTLESRDVDRVDATLASTLRAASVAVRADVAEAGATARRLATARAVQTAFLHGDRKTLTAVARANPEISFLVGSRLIAGPPVPEGAIVRGVEVTVLGRPIGRVEAALALDELLLRGLQAKAALGGAAVLLLVDNGRVIAGPTGAADRVELQPGQAGVVSLSGVEYRVLDNPLIGESSVRLAAGVDQRGIEEATARTRRSIVLASIATLLALALAADSLVPGVEQRARRRRKEDEREAMELLGNALVAAHDRHALLPVVLATMVEATGAVGGRLFEDNVEVARHGELSSPEDALRLTLSGGTAESRLVLYAPAGGFTAGDRALADLLARQASVALENARLHAIARHEAVTDPLTGLANRRRFMEELGTEVSRVHRYGRDVSVILVDLDDFKDINDRFGHSVGDDVLCAVAGVLLSGVRELDVSARLGGEEFAVLLPETNVEGAAILAERLRRQVAELQLAGPAGLLPVTASFGVAAGPSARSADALLEVADKALYRAKRDGKNRVRTAGEEA